MTVEAEPRLSKGSSVAAGITGWVKKRAKMPNFL
jgi:hypothetical protein